MFNLKMMKNILLNNPSTINGGTAHDFVEPPIEFDHSEIFYRLGESEP